MSRLFPTTKRGTTASVGAVVAAALLLLGACDNTFQPLDPSKPRISLWGYLDASADTQWIRVSVLRPFLRPSTDSLPLGVTLTDVATGRVMQLPQTTLIFHGVLAVDTAGLAVHDAWTTERMRPGAAYRLRAQPASGEAAEVLVRLPLDFQMDMYVVQKWVSRGTDTLRLTGLQFYANVTDTSFYYDSCGSVTESYSRSAAPGDTIGLVRAISLTRSVSGRRLTCGPPYVTQRVVTVVGSGSAWPKGSDLATAKLGPGATNVSGGAGFVAGVMTKKIPYENCDFVVFLSPAGLPAYCHLHYDSTSARIVGRVVDSRCGWGVRRATVSLQELDPGGPEPLKIRWTYTDTRGNYLINGLIPGMHYRMQVSRNEAPPGSQMSEYYQYETSVLFKPAEQISLDVDLQRGIFPCPDN